MKLSFLHPWKRPPGLAALFLFFITTLYLASNASAVDATFSWLPNTESTLAGYKIHYGTASRAYTQVVDVGKPTPSADGRVHGTVTGLTEGTTYYFAATTYDINGQESDYSNEISWTAPRKPPTPTIIHLSFSNPK